MPSDKTQHTEAPSSSGEVKPTTRHYSELGLRRDASAGEIAKLACGLALRGVADGTAGRGQIRQPHFGILAREDNAVCAGLEGGQGGGVSVVG